MPRWQEIRSLQILQLLRKLHQYNHTKNQHRNTQTLDNSNAFTKKT